ncbi:hypothetical protein [Sphingobacterium sp. BN32]|uniref:hypothetical protein n=1 Tax=Sphingobacterium sp. BN32 TaxID=3058432 RepID=UPI00265C9D9E|nr:hypothetical protein [Sphingobacterium sp. BN32]WKK60336.1 hypothetical protein QYC40_08840 [Sphingobacterium sp. BN32]
MNYSHWLLYHSYYRWIVLIAMLIQIVWIYINHRNKTTFEIKHYQWLVLFCMLYNIQLVLGWMLYLTSPISNAFWDDLPATLKNRQLRFFGLEHMSMMTLGIVLMNTLTFLVKKKVGTPAFTYLWKRYIFIYIIILASVPWSFSPLTSRPNFR